MTHPVLAEAECSIRGLASRTSLHNGDSGLCISPGPLEGPLLAKARRDPRHGAQKEGCHDRPFQQGQKGVGPAHQLPRNASSVSGLSILSPGHSGTPCASTLRQLVRDLIQKSPGQPCLEATLHTSEQPSCVGSERSALTEGDACAGQNEPRSRHVVEEQYLFRGIDAPPARCSENLGSLWQSSSRLLHLRRQLSLPNLFTKSTDALAHEWPSLPLYAFPPVALLPQVLRRVREQRDKLILIAPLWRNRPWVLELFQLLKAALWPIPLRRDLLSQANSTTWHPRPEPETVFSSLFLSFNPEKCCHLTITIKYFGSSVILNYTIFPTVYLLNPVRSSGRCGWV